MRKYILALALSLAFIYAKDVSGLKRYEKDIKTTINNLNNPTQKRLLKTALEFVKRGKIIRGSCWNYINAIYNKNKISKNQRVVVFKSKKRGPFARKNLFKSGDWIYHINHSYHNIEHSGMFIKWVDKRNFKALMLSYAGEKRANPARFKVYNIDSTYNILRAKGANMQDGYIPLKEYAIRHKISIFNALKLVRANKVDYITKEIDGKEKIFIKESAKIEEKKESKKEPTIKELIEEIERLKQRVKALEEKVN